MNIIESLKNFKKSILLPSKIEDLFNEAMTSGFVDDYEGAIKSLDEVIELSHNIPDVKSLFLYFKSEALLNLDRDDEALQTIEESIKLDDKNDFAWSIKGEILHGLDRQDESLKAYENALEHTEEGDDDIANILWMADLLSNLERHDDALKEYEKALKQDPNSIEGWFGKADGLLELGDSRASIIACEKGLAIDRDDIDLVIHYGILMLEIDNYEKALKYFDKAIILDSSDELAWYNKACALAKLNQKEEALDALTVATGIDSENKEFMKDEKDLENIKNEERFTRLLKQSL